jgi:hypothetical protein
MKTLLLAIVIAAAGYYAYGAYIEYGSRPRVSNYSLKTVEANPIPIKDFFELWTDVALKACAGPQPFGVTSARTPHPKAAARDPRLR